MNIDILEILKYGGSTAIIVFLGFIIFYIVRELISGVIRKPDNVKSKDSEIHVNTLLEANKISIQLKNIEEKLNNICSNDKLSDQNTKELSDTIRELTFQLETIIYIMKDTNDNVKELLRCNRNIPK